MAEDIKYDLILLTCAEAMTIAFLIILLAIEVLQIIAKSIKNRMKSYFSFQNILEICIMIGTTAYLCLAHSSIKLSTRIGGWTLFLAWANFTAYLCQISKVGEVAYSSVIVSKNIMMTLFIFVPSMIGFTFALYFFLHGNQQFREFGSAMLKLLMMLLGEFDYEDNFESKAVLGYGGLDLSVQVISLKHY